MLKRLLGPESLAAWTLAGGVAYFTFWKWDQTAPRPSVTFSAEEMANWNHEKKLESAKK
jgi:hypothetical protein